MLSMANSHKNLVTSILNKLFQIFVIDDVSSFKSINGLVDDYFEGLISSERLKCTNFDCYDFVNGLVFLKTEIVLPFNHFAIHD